MKTKFFKINVFLIILVTAQTIAGFLAMPVAVSADSSSSQIAALNQQIAQLQSELKQVGADKKTLQNAIKTLDLQRSEIQAQVAVTQSQISSTQQQIQQLGTQISQTQQTITQSQEALAKYLQNIQQSDNQPLLLQLLSAGNLSDFWQNLNQNDQVQSAVQEKTAELQTQEASLVTTQSAVQQQEQALSAQNSSLTSQQASLAATVSSKNQLLAETNNKESSYQKLLSQAEAQLQSFSNFTKNAGGDKLLYNQTVCDSWGCYYNQRDATWGADPLDGTQYSMASDGCLITAMAMVMTHYGYTSVTPATINENPANFAAYYPAYLLYTISADGATATRTTTTIDATLATGTPVIVGMNVYGGTHFVVLISGSNGNYVMRDPYVANGKDINFSSYYTMHEIYSIARVVING